MGLFWMRGNARKAEAFVTGIISITICSVRIRRPSSILKMCPGQSDAGSVSFPAQAIREDELVSAAGKRTFRRLRQDQPAVCGGLSAAVLSFCIPGKISGKIVNFYYNSRKVWIPGRHMEKLERLLIQQGVKKAFLEQTFSL